MEKLTSDFYFTLLNGKGGENFELFPRNSKR